jgi:hypothetical protein
MEHDSNLTSFR